MGAGVCVGSDFKCKTQFVDFALIQLISKEERGYIFLVTFVC